jgi:hypothetical protein
VSEQKLDEEAPNIERFMERFVLPVEGLWTSFEPAYSALPEPFKPIAAVFRGNIQSAYTVATIPYLIANSGVIQARFARHLIAARIRLLKEVDAGQEPTKEQQQRAFATASEKMDAELKAPETSKQLAQSVVRDLLRLLEREEFDVAARELLLETLVMMWGAFENFVSETVRLLVNVNPSLATVLLTDVTAKKHFPARGISVDDLANHGFNVASSMGDILLRDRQLESLPIIKDVMGTIFPADQELRSQLSDPGLWLLWQRRHLIVHRRGMIDENYRSKTSDVAQLGTRLHVTSDYVEASFSLVVRTAVAVLAALSNAAVPSIGRSA